jgi:hypothetical protein
MPFSKEIGFVTNTCIIIVFVKGITIRWNSNRLTKEEDWTAKKCHIQSLCHHLYIWSWKMPPQLIRTVMRTFGKWQPLQHSLIIKHFHHWKVKCTIFEINIFIMCVRIHVSIYHKRSVKYYGRFHARIVRKQHDCYFKKKNSLFWKFLFYNLNHKNTKKK